MARIDWALLCEHAFLDRREQMCLIGLVRCLSAPRLPTAVHRLMLVARLADINPVDEVDVSVGVVTPSGLHTARPGTGSVMITMAGEYVLATLHDFPLFEEGMYRFQIKLRGQQVVAVEIPVMAAEVEDAVAVQ